MTFILVMGLQISNFASIWFISLFLSIFATGILEMRWSGVGIDEWWRNEQFWVIGGVSAHLFAVFQGLLKVLAGIDTNFTVTSKSSDEDGDFNELYMFKWTTLLIPPTTLIIINLVSNFDKRKYFFGPPRVFSKHISSNFPKS